MMRPLNMAMIALCLSGFAACEGEGDGTGGEIDTSEDGTYSIKYEVTNSTGGEMNITYEDPALSIQDKRDPGSANPYIETTAEAGWFDTWDVQLESGESINLSFTVGIPNASSPEHCGGLETSISVNGSVVDSKSGECGSTGYSLSQP